MPTIVNRGAPDLTYKRHVRAQITCPNCAAMMDLDPEEIAIGNIVVCNSCDKNTYCPFEKAWYRRGRVVAGYIFTIIVSFALGVASNFASDFLKGAEDNLDAETINIQE